MFGFRYYKSGDLVSCWLIEDGKDGRQCRLWGEMRPDTAALLKETLEDKGFAIENESVGYDIRPSMVARVKPIKGP